jgi:hypothetical protein
LYSNLSALPNLGCPCRGLKKRAQTLFGDGLFGTPCSALQPDTPDIKFSSITDEIHDARNVMAHQGYSSLQHRVEYFADDIAEGWRKDADTVLINPKLYAARFELAFRQGSHIEKYRQLTDDVRIIRKYQYIRQWLRLDRTHPISKEVKRLEGCATLQDIHTQETVIRQMIHDSYNLI